MNIQTLDAEMKLYICDCAELGMSAPQITEKLHQEGFAWIGIDDVGSVIEEMNRWGK